MQNKQIIIPINIYALDELCATDQQLIQAAINATERSYAPYSKFSVGAAALLEDGTIVTGTNQENAAYPSGICAERTTLFYANSQYPNKAVKTLVVAARNERGELLSEPIPPCGACRQVMFETQARFGCAMRVLLYGTDGIIELKDVGQLLPLSFSASTMK